MKMFYLLITEEKNGKYRCSVVRHYQQYNLLTTLRNYPLVSSAQIFTVKSQAEKQAELANNGFKNANKYLEV